MVDHLSITASDLDRAQRFHAAALANGGDDGPPSIREIHSPEYEYYAAFARDPDGNRLEAVTRRPEVQP